MDFKDQIKKNLELPLVFIFQMIDDSEILWSAHPFSPFWFAYNKQLS